MQAEVNIVYPIDGESYPVGSSGVKSAYVTFSFGTTCNGGMFMVEWGVDGDTHGKAEFYDQFTGQYVMKLPAGTHVFWVRSSCGQNEVRFKVA